VTRLAIAWPVIALGIALLLDAELGVAPFDVLNTGAARAFDIPFAAAYLVMSIVFFAVGGALGGKLGWGSVIGTFVIGGLLPVCRWLVPAPAAIVPRAAMLVVAVVLLAIAVCLVVSTELGAGPSEVLMLGLIARNVPIVAARWVADGVPILIGVVLGGAAGVGTVILAFLLAPLIKIGLALLHYEPPHELVLEHAPAAD
jgi:uncharacterized membrane protein YczE